MTKRGRRTVSYATAVVTLGATLVSAAACSRPRAATTAAAESATVAVAAAERGTCLTR